MTLDGELPRRSLRARFASRSAMRPSMNSSESARSNGASPATSARSASIASRSGCQIAPAAGGGGGGATRPGPDRAAHARGGALPQLALGRLSRGRRRWRRRGCGTRRGWRRLRELLQLVEGVVEGLLTHRATITAGVVDIELQCPYCGEWVVVFVDPGGGVEQTYVEDCPDVLPAVDRPCTRGGARRLAVGLVRQDD